MSSPFGEILAEIVQALPGAQGAVFLDWEGEAVDQYAGPEQAEEIRLLGAHWAITYFQARKAFEQRDLGAADEMVLRFQHQQIIMRRVTDEYLVLLALADQSNLGRALHLLRRAERQLRGQM